MIISRSCINWSLDWILSLQMLIKVQKSLIYFGRHEFSFLLYIWNSQFQGVFLPRVIPKKLIEACYIPNRHLTICTFKIKNNIQFQFTWKNVYSSKYKTFEPKNARKFQSRIRSPSKHWWYKLKHDLESIFFSLSEHEFSKQWATKFSFLHLNTYKFFLH